VRADRQPLRAALNADHRQSAVRRMEQGLPRPSHDARGHRPPRPSRDHSGDERRKLSTPRCARSQTWARTATNTRDNQGKCLIVAPRQSTLTLSDNQSGSKKKLADLNDRHDHAFATGRRFKTRLPPFSSRSSRNKVFYDVDIEHPPQSLAHAGSV